MEQVTMKLSACIHLIGVFLHLIEGATDVISTKVRPRRSLDRPFFGEDDIRVVELLVVIDSTLIKNYAGDHRAIEQKVITTISHVNHLYSKFAIRVVVVGFEFWGNGDCITVSKDAAPTLDLFSKYEKEHLRSKKYDHDHAMLLSGKEFIEEGGSTVLGRAYTSGMCSVNPVSVIADNTDIRKMAWTIGHELGHSFGMRHDNTSCSCQTGDVCLMGTHFSGYAGWSSCSEEVMYQMRVKGGDSCLKNLPVSPYTTCGNNIVEPGEECDCGLPEYCTNPCCNATTCLLNKHAQCASGECCDTKTCKVKPGNVRCREKKGECDVAEYCDGTNEFCPIDRFQPDGTECPHGQGFCFKGVCPPSLSQQCVEIWGDEFKHVDLNCYRVNKENGSKGYCNFSYDSSGSIIYHPCADEDVMCGVLFCTTKGENALPVTNYKNFWRFIVYHAAGGKSDCRGIRTGGSVENGLVRDGTKCGDGKMCHENRCIDAKDVPQSCYQDCFKNGRCENGHCICNSGYKQPYCAVLASGLSGSAVAYIIFFLVLPGCLLIIACVYYKLHLYKKAPHRAWLKERRNSVLSYLTLHITQARLRFPRINLRRPVVAVPSGQSKSTARQKKISSVALIPVEPQTVESPVQIQVTKISHELSIGHGQKPRPYQIRDFGHQRTVDPVRSPLISNSGQTKIVNCVRQFNHELLTQKDHRVDDLFFVDPVTPTRINSSGQTKKANVIRPVNQCPLTKKDHHVDELKPSRTVHSTLKSSGTDRAVGLSSGNQSGSKRNVEVARINRGGLDEKQSRHKVVTKDEKASESVSALRKKFLAMDA